MSKLLWVSGLILFFIAESAIADRKVLSLDLSGGLIVSNEYHDFLKDNLDASSVSYGWADIGIGVTWAPHPQLSIMPGIDYLISAGTTEDVGGEGFINSIVLSRLAIRLLPRAQSEWYFSAEYIHANPDSDDDELFRFSSAGAGFGLFVGYSGNDRSAIEVGFQNIPIDAISSTGLTEEINFGGLAARIRFIP